MKIVTGRGGSAAIRDICFAFDGKASRAVRRRRRCGIKTVGHKECGKKKKKSRRIRYKRDIYHIYVIICTSTCGACNVRISTRSKLILRRRSSGGKLSSARRKLRTGRTGRPHEGRASSVRSVRSILKNSGNDRRNEREKDGQGGTGSERAGGRTGNPFKDVQGTYMVYTRIVCI